MMQGASALKSKGNISPAKSMGGVFKQGTEDTNII
jgi:hypothetical protein